MIQPIEPTIEPTEKQWLAYQYLWDNITNFVGFGGGAEGGKSWLGAEWLLQNCYRYPGSKWFIGRNELTRLMSSSYATWRKVCSHHKIPPEDWRYNGQYHYIEFRNYKTGKFDGEGSRIDLLDLKYLPSDPMFQRFGSTEYTGGWIEEAGEVHFLAFDVLKARVGRWKNKEYGLNPAKILLTFNPEQNWLYRVFYKPWKTGTLMPGYVFVQALYKDNPHTAEEAEKRLNLITDPILRARLKAGLWEYSNADNSLVDYDSIIDLFTNSLPEELRQEKYLTADVARYGSDKVVLGKWKGFEIYRIIWKQNRSIDATANDVKDELKKGQIPYSHCIADDDGVGGGVVDLCKGIKGFTGNSAALPVEDKTKDSSDPESRIKQNYKNMRSQCGFMLAGAIKNHEMAIKAKVDEVTKEMIIEDLQALLKKKETPIEAPLQLISKEEIKEALGRSPDFADMMLMRMFFTLKKPVNFQHTAEVGGIKPLATGIG